jgi:micrococcal nuclease
MKNLLFILLCGFFSAQQTVLVTRVIDGDTFHTQDSRFRIAEIDAPELNQVYGIQSKKYLSKLILYKSVKVKVLNTDKYGRKIVRVSKGNQDIAEKLVSTGNAWWYQKYSRNKKLKYLQDQAKSRKFGLWKYQAVNPHQYRKLNGKYRRK